MNVMKSAGSGLPGQRSNALRSMPSFLMGLSDEALAKWLKSYEAAQDQESIIDRKLRLARERREAEAKLAERGDT